MKSLNVCGPIARLNVAISVPYTKVGGLLTSKRSHFC